MQQRKDIPKSLAWIVCHQDAYVSSPGFEPLFFREEVVASLCAWIREIPEGQCATTNLDHRWPIDPR